MDKSLQYKSGKTTEHPDEQCKDDDKRLFLDVLFPPQQHGQKRAVTTSSYLYDISFHSTISFTKPLHPLPRHNSADSVEQYFNIDRHRDITQIYEVVSHSFNHLRDSRGIAEFHHSPRRDTGTDLMK